MEPWLPQDDFLLKNAVEAGASLESLAKGAVRFSRRYSFTEIRDRWRALLYDPAVSAAALAAMANLELAKYGGGGGSGEGGGGKKKRKVLSIRKHYHAMQKRLRRCRHRVAGSDVQESVEGCEGKEKLVIDDNLGLNCDVVNNSLGVGVGVGVGQLSHSVIEFPLLETIEDFSLPDMPVDVSVEGKSCGLEGECGNDGLKLNAPDAMLTDDSKNDSECLLNLENEDQLLFLDVDRKEVTAAADKDKPTHLPCSPCDVQGDGDGNCREPLSGSCADQCCGSESGNNAGSPGAVQIPHPKHREGFMFCVLNTEDTDIPSNDTTETPIVGSDLMPPKSQPVKELGYQETAISNTIRNESEQSLKKEAPISQSFVALQTVQQGLVPNVKSNPRPVVLALKSENSEIRAVSRQNNNANVNINPSRSRLVSATVMPASDGHLKQEETKAPASAHVKAEEHKALSNSEAKSSSLNQEGSDIEDDDDNDDELPNFSDAEEMILDMDLSPTDQDTNPSREVLRYLHEQSKRTIMRLEQGARSSMGRAISSQGAFAVVYGRILKKYIKKSKVILGRATCDVLVDIDLRKEGHTANKISRRQAIIKLEEDGSFIIKNLGKRSIFLNGKEISTGQARVLSTSSLIEIFGISLIFETNKKCVRKFLETDNEKRRR